MPSATISDVARAAGVSVATVSRVINDSAAVSANLRDRVLEAIEKTQYVPNVAGRSLRQQKSSLIAVVTPDPVNPYFMGLTAEVETLARSRGYGVILAHTEERVDVEIDIFRQLAARQVAGAVVVCASELESDLTPLTSRGIAVVLVDRAVKNGTFDVVATDNKGVGTTAAQHLWESGYRRPVCIAGPAYLSPTENRAHGLLEAWRSFTSVPPVVLRGDLHLESGYRLARQILREVDVDSFYVTNSQMSAGVFRALHEAGRLDIGLLGTDDDLWSSMVTPSVSVIEQPLSQTGRLAAQVLTDRLDSDEDLNTVHALLPATLIVRESTRRVAREL